MCLELGIPKCVTYFPAHDKLTHLGMSSITIGVFFGGPSPEHEVSVISGIQALSALREQGSTVHSVYVSKSGTMVRG